jgi:hypothetical protein
VLRLIIQRSVRNSFRPPRRTFIIEDTEDLFMRRRLVTFLLAALAAITIAVPLWAALRSERSLIADRTGSLQVHHTRQAPRPVAEAATLVLTGIMLIGLASAVRRTS